MQKIIIIMQKNIVMVYMILLETETPYRGLQTGQNLTQKEFRI